jgi:transposase-like protein
MYLYRAVASEGNTLEFLLSATRDAEAAKHFFIKALGASACSVPQANTIEKKAAQPPAPAAFKARNAAPRVINVDKNAAYPKAIVEFKASGILPALVDLRQVKYVNNLIEQDHRFIKRLVKPGMGFFSFDTAWKTLQGYEAMNMIRKGQVQGVNKGETPSQATFIAELWKCQNSEKDLPWRSFARYAENNDPSDEE